MVFPYVSRHINAPAEVASRALTRVGSDLSVRTLSGDRRIEVPGGSITLHGPGTSLEPPRPDLVWPVRSVPGVLVMRLRRIPLELEVTPWSAAWSEIGLRATGNRSARGDARQYLVAVAAAADLLAAEIRAWVEEPLFVEDAFWRSAS